MKVNEGSKILFLWSALFWVLLYLICESLTMTQGVFGNYRQYFFGISLAGLAFGLAGHRHPGKWQLARLIPIKLDGAAFSALLLALFFLFLLFLALWGYPNSIVTGIEKVLPDSSLGIYKPVFFAREVGRQVGVPIFLFMLLVGLFLGSLSFGSVLKEKLVDKKGAVVFVLAASVIWILSSFASWIPFGLVLLSGLAFGILFLISKKEEKGVALTTGVIVLVSVTGLYLLPFRGPFRAGLVSGAHHYDFAERVDLCPLFAGSSIKALATFVNHRIAGIGFARDLKDKDLKALAKEFKEFKKFREFEFVLPYLLSTNSEAERLLIIGPEPVGYSVAAVKSGFKDITVVARRQADIEAVRALLAPAELAGLKIVIEDGFKFLRSCRGSAAYDVICFTGAFDRQFINSYSILGFDDSLYTKESLDAARACLSPTGYVSFRYSLSYLPLNKIAASIKNSIGPFIAHFKTETGGYVVASSASGSGLKYDPVRISELQERFSSDLVRDPEALMDKKQLRYQSDWNLNFPYLQAFVPSLDLCHMAVFTMLMAIVIFSWRWVGDLNFLLARGNLSICLLAATMMILVSKASTVLALWAGTTGGALVLNQSLVWLPLALIPFASRFSQRLEKMRLPLLLAALLLVACGRTAMVVERGFLVGGLITTYLYYAITILILISVLVSLLSKEADDRETLASLAFGIGAGFVLGTGAFYGGVSGLDNMSLVLLLGTLVAMKRKGVASAL